MRQLTQAQRDFLADIAMLTAKSGRALMHLPRKGPAPSWRLVHLGLINAVSDGGDRYVVTLTIQGRLILKDAA
jgi:hypothetical protein